MNEVSEEGDDSVAYFRAYPAGTPHGVVAGASLGFWLLVLLAAASVAWLGLV